MQNLKREQIQAQLSRIDSVAGSRFGGDEDQGREDAMAKSAALRAALEVCAQSLTNYAGR